MDSDGSYVKENRIGFQKNPSRIRVPNQAERITIFLTLSKRMTFPPSNYSVELGEPNLDAIGMLPPVQRAVGGMPLYNLSLFTVKDDTECMYSSYPYSALSFVILSSCSIQLLAFRIPSLEDLVFAED